MPRIALYTLPLLSLAILACGKDSSGPSSLSLFGCDDGQTYTVGTNVNATLSSSDCRDPDGEAFADYYEFRMTETGPIAIQVQSSAGVVIGVADESEEFIGFDMAEPGEPAMFSTILPPGRYILVVAGTAAGRASSYSITSRRSLLFCDNAQSYAVGATVNGTLASTDCRAGFGEFLDRYDFTLAAATTVVIDLESVSFDAYLYVFSSTGALVAFNDDRGDGTFHSRVTVTLQPGTYSIGATSYTGSSGGPYTLTSR